jgi:hypothetical protein
MNLLLPSICSWYALWDFNHPFSGSESQCQNGPILDDDSDDDSDMSFTVDAPPDAPKAKKAKKPEDSMTIAAQRLAIKDRAPVGVSLPAPARQQSPVDVDVVAGSDESDEAELSEVVQSILLRPTPVSDYYPTQGGADDADSTSDVEGEEKNLTLLLFGVSIYPCDGYPVLKLFF